MIYKILENAQKYNLPIHMSIQRKLISEKGEQPPLNCSGEDNEFKFSKNKIGPGQCKLLKNIEKFETNFANNGMIIL